MTAVGIVPARFASSRFPGKPLVEISGRPMIQHVVEGARRSKRLRDVLVATDDERIALVCRGFGAPVVMTAADHPSGTDRLAEAAADLADEIVVNIQGDEPLVDGFVIDAAVDALSAGDDMSTLVHRAEPGALADPNRVKVVLDRAGYALYFSRSPIPHGAERGGGAERPPGPSIWQHVGLYAYRREFLMRWPGLTPTPLEQAERLEQLRALEHGHRIRVAVIGGWRSAAVDVPADVATVEGILAERDRAAT